MIKEFKKKYKEDKKFKAKAQLIGYSLFALFVAIFASANYETPYSNNTDNNVRENYNYQVNINLNDNLYHYYGTKENNEITINKVIDEETINYLYKENNYYKLENELYVLTTEEEICDVIELNYLSIETINKYLSLSIITEDQNVVYLKDIIIGNNSDEYITISKETNKYNIDYTSLMKLFDSSIEKLTVEIIIE